MKQFEYRVKELHLYLDDKSIYEDYQEGLIDSDPYNTYEDTLCAFERTANSKIRTVIPEFLSFRYAATLYVHYKGITHEIKEGKVEGLTFEVNQHTDLRKVLFDGEFDWFKPEKER